MKKHTPLKSVQTEATRLHARNTIPLINRAEHFMRGTNADHVLVLIDGIKVGSVTTGTSPFEFILQPDGACCPIRNAVGATPTSRLKAFVATWATLPQERLSSLPANDTLNSYKKEAIYTFQKYLK